MVLLCYTITIDCFQFLVFPPLKIRELARFVANLNPFVRVLK